MEERARTSSAKLTEDEMTIDWPNLSLGFAAGWTLYWLSIWVSGYSTRKAERDFAAGVDRAGEFSPAFRGDLEQAIRLQVEDQAERQGRQMEKIERVFSEHEARPEHEHLRAPLPLRMIESEEDLSADELEELRRGSDPESSVVFKLGSVLGSRGVTSVAPSLIVPEPVATMDAEGGEIHFHDPARPGEELPRVQGPTATGPWTRIPPGEKATERFVCAAEPVVPTPAHDVPTDDHADHHPIDLVQALKTDEILEPFGPCAECDAPYQRPEGVRAHAAGCSPARPQPPPPKDTRDGRIPPRFVGLVDAIAVRTGDKPFLIWERLRALWDPRR